MQGIVFSQLSNMVIEQFGMQFWNEVLEATAPDSQGVYTASAQYDDSELFALVTTLSEKTKMPVEDLVRAFGEFLFPKLLMHLPFSFENHTMKDFLQEVDQVIHKEVERMYPGVYLPKIHCIDTGEKSLTLVYHSKRKLCHLAEGLIYGAAKHFSSQVTLNHAQCMHRGDEDCHLLLEF
ncbi:MAG: heme NO-binding domain-containing protein [Methylococcales bacterium]|jgi:predicted hydrocarbon binding protein|nr:heme NO-binding domain-containing protein [Methylococcales bacterium]MBT7443669.1 heme NO-binding domain-containing protein [Methylococcales bacterium]